MTRESDDGAPSVWLRALAVAGAIWFLGYSAVGLWRNDLYVSLSKSSGDGIHLHRPLAVVRRSAVVFFRTFWPSGP